MERFSQSLLTCLLNATWQIALISAVGACAAWLLRETAARWRHMLWAATLTMCFCLPLLSGYRSWSRPTIDPSELRSEIGASELRASPIRVSIDQAPTVKETEYFLSIGRNLAAGLVGVYLLFIGFGATRLLGKWMQARSIAQAASEIDLTEAFHSILHHCQTALGLRFSPKLCSAPIPVPITVGSLKPLVILPDRLLLEDDGDVVTSAIGHELVHIRRRDYAFNLIFELIHLPLSFHPAAALVRRRIKETRELSCDEMVAERLMDARAYARSLVRLAGAALAIDGRTTISVGLADADILEERVMRILNRPKTNSLKTKLALIGVTILLIATCAGASTLAMGIDIHWQDPVESSPQTQEQDPNNVSGLQTEVVMPPVDQGTGKGAVEVWLKRLGDRVKRGEIIAKVDLNTRVVDIPATVDGVIERLLVTVGQKTSSGATIAIIRPETEQSGSDQTQAQENALRELLEAQAKLERVDQTTKQDDIDAVREALAKLEREHHETQQNDIRALRETLAQLERERQSAKENEIRALVEAQARLEREQQTAIQDAVQRGAKETERELLERAARHDAGQDQRMRDLLLGVYQVAERSDALKDFQKIETATRLQLVTELNASQQAELAKQAKITMRQAIQIATNKYPGKVLESRLTDELNQPCYLITILSETVARKATKSISVSAVDGRILKVVQ